MIRDYKNSDLAFQQVQKKKFAGFNLPQKKVMVLISFLVLVFCFLLIMIQRNGPEVITTRWGRLADDFDGQGLLVRKEQVVYAPFAGVVRILAEEGARYRPGEPILELEGSNGQKVFYSRDDGVISYQMDGLETTLQPIILENFQQDYRDFRGKAFHIQDGDKVNAGRPLYKLVDNYQLYLLVEAPKDQVFRYRVNERVWANMDGVESIGYVRKILDYRNLFVIELERFPTELLNKRWVDLNILTDAETGVIVPIKSIAIKDGQMGVYLVEKDQVYFEPVKELGHNQEEMVITKVRRGVDILADPERDLEKYIQDVKSP